MTAKTDDRVVIILVFLGRSPFAAALVAAVTLPAPLFSSHRGRWSCFVMAQVPGRACSRVCRGSAVIRDTAVAAAPGTLSPLLPYRADEH